MIRSTGGLAISSAADLVRFRVPSKRCPAAAGGAFFSLLVTGTSPLGQSEIGTVLHPEHTPQAPRGEGSAAGVQRSEFLIADVGLKPMSVGDGVIVVSLVLFSRLGGWRCDFFEAVHCPLSWRCSRVTRLTLCNGEAIPQYWGDICKKNRKTAQSISWTTTRSPREPAHHSTLRLLTGGKC